jgi:2-oxoglutarate dehydrogenase complex dehydrogenase (E1) component-like enzyme
MDRHPDLELGDFALTEKDLDRKFSIGFKVRPAQWYLMQIVEKSSKSYTAVRFAFEYGYVRVKEVESLSSEIK